MFAARKLALGGARLPEYIGRSFNQVTSPANTISVTLPAGTAPGDVVVAWGFSRNFSTTGMNWPVPAGWAGNALGVWGSAGWGNLICARTVQSGDSAFLFPITGGNAVSGIRVELFVWRGGALDLPVVEFTNRSGNGVLTMPARTASKRALLLAFVLGVSSETVAATTPAGMTLFYGMNVPTPESILKVFVEEVGAGSTGDIASTISSATSRTTVGALVLIAGK